MKDQKPKQSKTAMKVIRWLLFTAFTYTAAYLASKGHVGVKNLLTFYLFLWCFIGMLLVSFFDDSHMEQVKKNKSPIPKWLKHLDRVVFLLILVWNGWWLMTTFQFLIMLWVFMIKAQIAERSS